MKTQTNICYPETATRALDILKKAGYFPKVVGYGPVPPVPRYEKGWLLDPVQDVHPYAKAPVGLLRASGVPILGFVLAHELELVVVEEPKPDFKVKSTNILPAVAITAEIVTLLTVGVFTAFIHALSSIDPSFITVIDDPEKTWIECVNWRT